jgi:hypothetical protein
VAETLVCRYADIKSYGATWSRVSGASEVAAFPMTNWNSPYADRVAKFDSTAVKVRATIASTAIQGIVIVNCNLAGLTLTITNGGGMASQSLVVPAANADGLSLNAWKDLRLVTTAATTWDIDIPTNAANVAIGKIILVADFDAVRILWNWRMKETTPATVKRTSRHVAVGYPSGTRYRAASVDLVREADRSTWTNLRRGSVGPSRPAVLIPDSTVNDPLYGWFPSESWDHERVFERRTTWTDTVEEMNPGVAL